MWTIGVLQLIVFVAVGVTKVYGGALSADTAYTLCIDDSANCLSLAVQSSSLTGSIPTEIGTLTAMALLNLDDNTLTGTLPTELGEVIALTVLYVGTNSMSGKVPSELGLLTDLEFMDLRTNGFTGQLPTELGALAAVTYMRIKENSLKGSIPTELGALTNVNTINFDTNELTGPLPEELANAVALEYLDLDTNKLTGTLPAALSDLTDLKELNLWNNNFMSTIPKAYKDFAALTLFRVMVNPLLCGDVPDGITLDDKDGYTATEETALGGACPSPPPASPSPPPPVMKPPRPVLSLDDVHHLTAAAREFYPGHHSVVEPGKPGSNVKQDTEPDGHNCPPGYHVMGDHRGGKYMGKKKYWCMKNEKMNKMADFQNTLDPNGVSTVKGSRGVSTQKSMFAARLTAESNNVVHRNSADDVRELVTRTRKMVANTNRARISRAVAG